MRDSFESLYYEPMLPYLTALVPLAPVEHIPQSEASAPKFDSIFEQILFRFTHCVVETKNKQLNFKYVCNYQIRFFIKEIK